MMSYETFGGREMSYDMIMKAGSVGQHVYKTEAGLQRNGSHSEVLLSCSASWPHYAHCSLLRPHMLYS